jgi:L-aspartate oxidase
MSDYFARRRYLIDFESRRLGQVFTDVLVVGSGVAGLRAAIEASSRSHVIVICKDDVYECNTAYAQGGIASASDPSDSVAAHVEDTLRLGCGLGDRSRVEAMAGEASARLRELTDWGAQFDHESGAVALGMEGGHSARRILHASGDATGREISRTLHRRVAQSENVRIFENCFVIDFVAEEGRCQAALTFHEKYGHQIIWAKQIILASGGAGCLYRETTNSPAATADGLAIAFRAGAQLRDMEFVQFHPTALYIAGAARALISEAVRGEGGYLVDRGGDRFMSAFHPDAELAPRDVVSRAILSRIVETHSTCVFLDVRHFPAGQFARRFPNIDRLCRQFDIDPATDTIPVRPAAHYMIGGVAVDAIGRSSVDGLLACGEAAATGVHGANRLASNSLLEGLVFGQRAGQAAAEFAQERGNGFAPHQFSYRLAPSPRTELDLADVRNSLRALCWRNLGIDRSGDRLRETIEIVDFWARYVLDKVLSQRTAWETQNMLTVSRCIAQASLARAESRGVHYRADHPGRDDRRFLGHITIERIGEAIREVFEPLTAFETPAAAAHRS